MELQDLLRRAQRLPEEMDCGGSTIERPAGRRPRAAGDRRGLHPARSAVGPALFPTVLVGLGDFRRREDVHFVIISIRHYQASQYNQHIFIQKITRNHKACRDPHRYLSHDLETDLFMVSIQARWAVEHVNVQCHHENSSVPIRRRRCLAVRCVYM